MNYLATPIPEDAGQTEGWQKIPVVESGEPLVPIGVGGSYPELLAYAAYENGHLADASQDSELLGSIYVRQSVADDLIKAQSLLPSDLRLLVLDGLRTSTTQQKLYDHFLDKLTSLHPGISSEKLHNHTQKFVSTATSDHSCPAPHTTGGAVDVVLVSDDGMLNFGTAFDHGSEKSSLRFYEDNSQLTQPDSVEARENRRLLYWVMHRAGFEGYSHEWWHFNATQSQMGAQAAGLEHATYGFAEPPAEKANPSNLPFSPDKLWAEQIAPSSDDMVQ